jgi:cytochrome c nitrite reductase small subunit
VARRLETAAVVAASLAGLAGGVAVYTFAYAKGASYLTNRPAACANCHVMNDQYAGWVKSSHRAVAGCNDCHTPKPVLAKYAVKASNGFWHSWAFTTGRFHEPIQIKPRNRAVAEGACRSCHSEVVAQIDGHPAQGSLACVRCHSEVGHP